MNRTASLLLSLVFCMALGACASSAEPVSAGSAAPARRSANEISVEELKEPSVNSLSIYDAIARLRPNWLRSRGATSISNANETYAGLVLNDVAQSFEVMRSIRAAEVTSAVYMSAADATTRFGTGYPNGVIMISTARR